MAKAQDHYHPWFLSIRQRKEKIKVRPAVAEDYEIPILDDKQVGN